MASSASQPPVAGWETVDYSQSTLAELVIDVGEVSLESDFVFDLLVGSWGRLRFRPVAVGRSGDADPARASLDPLTPKEKVI